MVNRCMGESSLLSKSLGLQNVSSSFYCIASQSTLHLHYNRTLNCVACVTLLVFVALVSMTRCILSTSSPKCDRGDSSKMNYLSLC